MRKNELSLRFIDEMGSFRIVNPDNINELYFPLCNEAGLMSSVTPMLHGDCKTSQQNFLLQPVTVEDLHNTRSARNFWFYIHDWGAWSATGNSARQNALKFTRGDSSVRTIEAGLLWHRLKYEDNDLGLVSEILNFIPSDTEKVEIMKVTLTNKGGSEIKVTPTSAIPLYGRSAENIRDHRHVTSLVNRLTEHPFGISAKPLIVFDERKHRYNTTQYFVAGSESDGTMPAGSIPLVHRFIGKAGAFDWPEAVVKNTEAGACGGGDTDGKEYVGALRFADAVLKSGESREYIIIMGITDDASEIEAVYRKYNTSGKIEAALQKTRDFWVKLACNITFESGMDGFSNWMKWVAVQPVLRKIFGCSFLPYHDYGKGGRGWRDLWQDCLSLILLDPASVRGLLLDNFGGVRSDGTNATIIGSKAGEFKADRNNIARVWMDHGVWPYLTTKFYMDQSGDYRILFEEQVYFRDSLIMRASRKDELWEPGQGSNLKTADGGVYKGTVLEHIIVQHLTSFFNVGEHNIIRLEGGDWNDTLDMARERGESTAFTALYAGNLTSLSELLLNISDKYGIESLELFEEILALLDTLSGKPDYSSIEYKKNLLERYLKSVSDRISGTKAVLSIKAVAADLRRKGEAVIEQIRRNEWIETSEGDGFFNGYYNNNGQRVDGVHADGVGMSLTGQVFTAMFGLATDEQVSKMHRACRKYLKDPNTGGYRLNTGLGENKLNFGRGFAFAYGEKENGSTFCHMVVMYMNALYKRGFVREAFEVLDSLYSLSADTGKSGIYPGIPEYFTPSGKGMYHWLTGSASWLLLTVLTDVYGVKGELGDLVIEPRLTAEQFDGSGTASVISRFKGRKVAVSFSNPSLLDYADYRILKASLNGRDISQMIDNGRFIKVPQDIYETVSACGTAEIEVTLG